MEQENIMALKNSTGTSSKNNNPTLFPISSYVRRLKPTEIEQYEKSGYIKNLPVFAPEAVSSLQTLFEEFTQRLPESVDINKTNCWHKASKKFHDLCRVPPILDYVEELIGPNFFQWGGQFFVKYPKDGSEVPWHQDAQYWPLTPQNTVTVWLAIFDVDEKNAAMKIVEGSHKLGIIKHSTNNAPHLVLNQEAEKSMIQDANVRTIDLKAGEISLHNDSLLHSSGPNNSDRMRAGITMRFSPTNVKCDLSVWPNFEINMARGTDRYKLNPQSPVPKNELFPVKLFQHSSEF